MKKLILLSSLLMLGACAQTGGFDQACSLWGNCPQKAQTSSCEFYGTCSDACNSVWGCADEDGGDEDECTIWGCPDDTADEDECTIWGCPDDASDDEPKCDFYGNCKD
jgi:hypothetical protein